MLWKNRFACRTVTPGPQNCGIGKEIQTAPAIGNAIDSVWPGDNFVLPISAN
jgi:hypothetical protein